jgi:hypothetical protein
MSTMAVSQTINTDKQERKDKRRFFVVSVAVRLVCEHVKPSKNLQKPLKREGVAWRQWLMPVILATQEAEFRRISG